MDRAASRKDDINAERYCEHQDRCNSCPVTSTPSPSHPAQGTTQGSMSPNWQVVDRTGLGLLNTLNIVVKAISNTFD
ncbi:hypothetical protein KIN20_011429 [Parelaphostrongylus tenuis]|uniref:Uncharacterized protein n=1 Tax=Parelaphostrongylus tenuis TaxID=148309 RepID=A0AAD5MS21_PARTN|nr:hypothetical protein KIN20_011429 [Parelaphostrongylus tenuis]